MTEAWSHPFQSNVLTDWHAMTAYAASDWGDEGTPVVPYSLAFDGANTFVNCGSDASLDDLHDAAMTVEAWIRADGWGESGQGIVIDKSANSTVGWSLIMHPSGVIYFIIYCATTNTTANAAFVVDGLWHHVAVTWDDAVDTTPTIYLDGNVGASGTSRSGAVTSDTAANMTVGALANGAYNFDGDIAWIRISDSIRYTDTFVPPSRLNPPANDANAVAQYNFRDGSGTTLTDENGTNDGTIANGAWNTVADMSTDALGARVYAGGYTIGADAAAEGITQTLTGLDAGQSYVARPVISYEDARAQPIIRVYDETNSANIVDFAGPWLNGVHDGGDGESALAEAAAPYWPASLVGGTIYNITDSSSGTITACGTTITATLAGGTDDDWDDDDVYMIVPPARWVWTEPFTWELPTTARNGSAADCVSMSVQILNGNDEGVFYLHQVECLANFIDNPSAETGAVADPWIPDGWAGLLLGAGEAVQETTDIHSGSSCWKKATTASHGIIPDQYKSKVDGAYYAYGFWQKAISGTGLHPWSNSSYLPFQTTWSTNPSRGIASTNWNHYGQVMRDRGNPGATNSTYGSATYLVDDVYLLPLTPVSLTVTPASEANSTESTGLRVDGDDEATATIANLTATSGHIRTGATPRHSAADAVSFGNTSAYILEAYGAADNYIRAYWSGANEITLAFNDGSGEHTTSFAPRPDADWWVEDGETVVAAYQPMGAASLAASYVNLANPGTYNAAPGVAPTFAAATGWTFNGTTQYLTTGVVPSDGASIFVRFSGNGVASASYIIGARTTGADGWLIGNGSFDKRAYYNGASLTVGAAVSNGVQGFAGKTAYYNGSSDGTIAAGSVTTDKALYIGGFNNNGSASLYNVVVQAIAVYSTTLDATQVAALTDRMNGIVADTTYQFAVDYTAAGMTFSVNGEVWATIDETPNFATVPTSVHWGSDNSGGNQWDATFSAPA